MIERHNDRVKISTVTLLAGFVIETNPASGNVNIGCSMLIKESMTLYPPPENQEAR